MSENQNIEEKTAQMEHNEQSPDAAQGIQSSTDGYFERADALLKRLEETEKRIDSKRSEYDKLLARDMLGGRSNAGVIQKSKEQLEKEAIEEEAKKIASSY